MLGVKFLMCMQTRMQTQHTGAAQQPLRMPLTPYAPQYRPLPKAMLSCSDNDQMPCTRQAYGPSSSSSFMHYMHVA